MKEEQSNIIKCPYCGCEYLPGEIYLPKHFLGQPIDVDRTIEKKIDSAYGIMQDLTETYTCDSCNKIFKVSCKMKFETSYDTKYDLDSEYIVPLYEDRLILKED